jgi:tellurite resistance protein
VDDAERTKVYQLIDAVITADGVVTPEEQEFIRKAALRLRLPDEASPVSLRDLGSATSTLRGLGPDTQSRVLALLVEAAIVDGVVEPRERALLLAAAATLGIEATALEERIARRLGSSVAGL